MAIHFETTENTRISRDHYHRIAAEQMRPISREYDEREHEMPWEWVNYSWEHGRTGAPVDFNKPSDGMIQIVVQAEELCWGDCGLYLRMPMAGLGGSAVGAAGTEEQKERFLSPFRGDGPPIWGAMAITEASAGSDAAAIQTTAELDGDDWVLNGTKIFCTGGEGAATYEGGFVVVWATVDRSAGRGGIKSFVVPAGTPGMKLVGTEKKLGIRASDTATLIFESCRVPRANLLGSAEVKKRDAKKSGDKGFKGAMATFDASRPIVAAMAIGVGRAALEVTQEELETRGVRIRYDQPAHALSAVERDFMEMEAQLQAARLLTWRAAWMMGKGQAQQSRGLDGQGQGGRRSHEGDPEGRRAARPRRLLEAAPRREVDARRQDQRHLRGHPADQSADRARDASSTIRRACCARSRDSSARSGHTRPTQAAARKSTISGNAQSGLRFMGGVGWFQGLRVIW